MLCLKDLPVPNLSSPIIRRRFRPVQQVAAGADTRAAPPPLGSNWGLGGPPLCIEYRRLDAITLPVRQLRSHKAKQITQVAASIRQFGFIEPVLVDAAGGVVAGACRVLAARSLNLPTIPTICIDHLTEAQRRAYAIAANRLAELSGWDEELLRLELGELAVLDLDFSIELTGFATAEIDTMLIRPDSDAADDPADVVPIIAAPPTSRLGDCFLLGDHRLICGDARDEAAYAALMGGEKARVIFCDSPYNVKIKGNVCGTGSIQHDEFKMASGEMSRSQFSAFLAAVFHRLAAVSVDGSIHFQCMDWRHMGEMLEAGEAAYTELKNVCVWVKRSAGLGSCYRSQHEMVFVFKSGTAPHSNTFGLGETGRYRTNIWTYPGANGFPNKKYDDQVDALTQFLQWSGTRAWRGRQARDPNTGRPLGQKLSWRPVMGEAFR